MVGGIRDRCDEEIWKLFEGFDVFRLKGCRPTSRRISFFNGVSEGSDSRQTFYFILAFRMKNDFMSKNYNFISTFFTFCDFKHHWCIITYNYFAK